MTQNKSYSRPLRHLCAHLLPPCLRSPQLPPPATCGSENASGRSCFGASSAAVPSAQNALPPNTYVVIASLLSGLCSNVILSERSSRTILSRIAWARARAHGGNNFSTRLLLWPFPKFWAWRPPVDSFPQRSRGWISSKACRRPVPPHPCAPQRGLGLSPGSGRDAGAGLSLVCSISALVGRLLVLGLSCNFFLVNALLHHGFVNSPC